MAKVRNIVTMIGTLLALPSHAYAWGDEGHKVVALIAEHYLLPATKAKVDALLSGPALPGHPEDKAEVPDDIADRATWADRYRDSDRRPNVPSSRYAMTSQWHFVDIELDAPDADAACFGHPQPATPFPGRSDNCVADKIRQFTAVIRDPTASTDDKTVALQFLLHFVGDVHQPLHSADNHDRGGNDVAIRYSYVDGGRTHTVTGNLHAYWDKVVVSRLGASPDLIAATLIGSMPRHFGGRWKDADPMQWAKEANAVARSTAYRLPSSPASAPIVISASYATKATGAARKQLQFAGYRLAMLLNDALR